MLHLVRCEAGHHAHHRGQQSGHLRAQEGSCAADPTLPRLRCSQKVQQRGEAGREEAALRGRRGLASLRPVQGLGVNGPRVTRPTGPGACTLTSAMCATNSCPGGDRRSMETRGAASATMDSRGHHTGAARPARGMYAARSRRATASPLPPSISKRLWQARW